MAYYLTKDELAHATGWTKPNHKYIDRIWKNGKWNYIYAQAQQGLQNAKRGLRNGFGFKARQNMNAAANKLAISRGSYNENKSRGVYDNDAKARDAQVNRVRQAETNYRVASNAYKNTALGKLEAAGTKAAARLKKGASYLTKRIKKKKKKKSGGVSSASPNWHTYADSKMDKSITYH